MTICDTAGFGEQPLICLGLSTALASQIMCPIRRIRLTIFQFPRVYFVMYSISFVMY